MVGRPIPKLTKPGTLNLEPIMESRKPQFLWTVSPIVSLLVFMFVVIPKTDLGSIGCLSVLTLTFVNIRNVLPEAT